MSEKTMTAFQHWASGGELFYVFYRKWRIGRVKIKISWRSSDNFTGRFGGGWNWKLGVQVSRCGFIISLLVMDINVSWYKPKSKEEPK